LSDVFPLDHSKLSSEEADDHVSEERQCSEKSIFLTGQTIIDYNMAVIVVVWHGCFDEKRWK